MAAVYLHNALYTSSSSDNTRESYSHSRNISSLSNATLFSSTTHHSHPTQQSHSTQPLLQPSPAAEEHIDQIPSPQNDDPVVSHLRWDDSNALPDHSPPVEKTGCPTTFGARRGRWKIAQYILEIIAALWAVYNTVRYFIAFAIFRDSIGQTVCLALGTSAGTSFALILCALILSLLRTKTRLSFDDRTFTFIQSFLRTMSFICLLGPAVVNFILVFLWRDSSNSTLSLRSRCHWDIDALWSITREECSPDRAPLWKWWIVAISLRLALTIVILTSTFAISLIYPDLRRRRRPRHYRPASLPSMRQHHSASSLPSMRQHHSTSSIPVPSLSVRQPSDISLNTTLVEAPMSQHSAIHLPHSRSSDFSAEGSSAEHVSFGRSTLAETADQDRELTGFVDRFRSLISQITQETEEALEIARSEGAPSPNSRESAASPESLPPSYTPDFESQEDEGMYEDHDNYDHPRLNDTNIYNLPPVPPALGYNEFGLPYPPDENVRFLNGLIRRMPTIESMGSGEIGSLGTSTRPNGSMHTSSRPPTRNTLLSWSTADYEVAGTSSNPPSRSNSLSARAELLIGMSPTNGTSEHGELLYRESSIRRTTPPSTPSSTEHPLASTSISTHEAHSSTNGSRSTYASYHTASMTSTGTPGTYPFPPLSESSS